MNKLKNIDFKSLLINHGEKFCLGIVALIAVFALVGTSWGTYKDTTPSGMIDTANKTRDNMINSKFTPDDAKEFLTVDEGGPNPNIRKEAGRLRDAVNLARLEYSTPMTWPVIKKGEPIRAIEYVKPLNVIVTADRTLIPLNARAAAELEADSEDTELAALDESMADDVEEEESDSEFTRRKGNRGQTGGRGMASGGMFGGTFGGSEMGGGYNGGMDEDADDEDEDYSDYGSGDEGGGLMGSPMGGYGGGMRGGMTEKKAVPSKGYHYASVRAIFPLRTQQREVAKAMGLSATHESLEQLVYLTDLVVERKTATKDVDPWSGDWEQVDIQTALDVLAEADGIETDVVRPSVTDPALTMPLPPRMVGWWDKDGSHPALKSYELSELDQELLRKRDEQLLKFGKEQEEAQDVSGPAQKGGFARTQVNINGIRSSVMGNSAGGGALDSYNTAMRDFTTQMGEQTGAKTDLNKRLKELDGETASGYLLLIRFLDFTVTPGREYKYRVRVELRNPLFNLPIEELANPELASRRTWQTDWSDSSAAVKVPGDYEYFVHGADERLGRETQAEIDVFQWFKEAGSLINGILKVYPGQFIGARKKTEVLRYAAETFKEEAVEFTTDDLLVDVSSSLEVDPDDHPFLKVPKRRGGFRLPAEILVMNRFYEVESMDAISGLEARTNAHARYQEMVTENEDLKQASAQGTDPYGYGGGDEEGGEYNGGMGGMMGGVGGMMGGGRGGSSRRRGRRGRSPLGAGGGDEGDY